MSHTCHWPDCKLEVPPKMWGCRKHWFTLPLIIRSLIWHVYVPGQEIAKNPTQQYLNAFDYTQRWALAPTKEDKLLITKEAGEYLVQLKQGPA